MTLTEYFIANKINTKVQYYEDIDYIFRSERNREAIIRAGINPHRFDRVHDMYPRRHGNREWDVWVDADWANMTMND